MAIRKGDSIIQAPVSYTWNKLEPLCIRNMCNITVYCYVWFLWEVHIQLYFFKRIIYHWPCRL